MIWIVTFALRKNGDPPHHKSGETEVEATSAQAARDKLERMRPDVIAMYADRKEQR